MSSMMVSRVCRQQCRRCSSTSRRPMNSVLMLSAPPLEPPLNVTNLTTPTPAHTTTRLTSDDCPDCRLISSRRHNHNHSHHHSRCEYSLSPTTSIRISSQSSISQSDDDRDQLTPRQLRSNKDESVKRMKLVGQQLRLIATLFEHEYRRPSQQCTAAAISTMFTW